MNSFDSSNVVLNTTQTNVANFDHASSMIDKSIVVTPSGEKIVTTNDSSSVIVTGQIINIGSSLITNLNDLSDVSATQPIDGAVLVYDSSDMIWKASQLLNKQNIDAGEF